MHAVKNIILDYKYKYQKFVNIFVDFTPLCIVKVWTLKNQRIGKECQSFWRSNKNFFERVEPFPFTVGTNMYVRSHMYVNTYATLRKSFPGPLFYIRGTFTQLCTLRHGGHVLRLRSVLRLLRELLESPLIAVWYGPPWISLRASKEAEIEVGLYTPTFCT